MARSNLWRTWLIVATGLTAAAGLMLATLAATGATGIIATLFDLVSVPDGVDTPPGDAATFALGLTGAVMFGWAATMLVLLLDASDGISRIAWRAITAGVLAWFAVDGVVSVTSGAFGNVALNIFFLAMFVPPLISTRQRS